MRRTHISIALATSLLGFVALGFSTFTYLAIGASEKVAPSIIQSLNDATIVLVLQCVYFLASFLGLHFSVGFILSWLSLSPAVRLTGSDNEARKLNWLIFLIFVFTVVLANKLYFPDTIMSFTTLQILEGHETKLVFALSSCLLIWLTIGLLFRVAELGSRLARKPYAVPLTVCVLVLLASLGLTQTEIKPRNFPQDRSKPNVIIVGIDSWRPETVPAYGGPNNLMPFVADYLSRSNVFEEAITPLARSYPSWWTILDGRYPHQHGIRFNLAPTSEADKPLRLPEKMAALGYHRIFAMDERRFAPIDLEHGFDQLVGPRTGAGDFLLGTLNDTPLANFVINTDLGRLLFPYSHGNRAVATTYLPRTFDALLSDALRSAPRKPLFLAVHYELPHWPYTWAHGPTGKYEHLEGGQSYTRYLETLNRVDQQVEALFDKLESFEILQNSFVIFLADHGEAFAFDSTARQALLFSNTKNHATSEKPSAASTMLFPGHGTHIFSITQHRVPLAYRDMRIASPPAGMRPGRASLIDIAPSIISVLGGSSEDFEGLDLTQFMRPNAPRIPDRMIPLETGFSPPSVITGNPDESKLLAEAAAHYEVTPRGGLVLRPQSQNELIRRKQLGLLYKNWIIASLRNASNKVSLYDLSRNRHNILDTQPKGDETMQRHFKEACTHIQRQRRTNFPICLPASGTRTH
ncbi:MAG: sulfatase-like hydrolase/transferase [Verrucomicrobia bacterium]|nr:sulfatase-like hydrolase/transferase [Verrucomicrobiota bacterium]